jgi:Trk-type K+ transport system membrane component
MTPATMRSFNVISLEAALIFFLFLSCLLFSIMYAMVDNHSKGETLLDLAKNMKLFFVGLILCALLVNFLQSLFGT